MRTIFTLVAASPDLMLLLLFTPVGMVSWSLLVMIKIYLKLL